MSRYIRRHLSASHTVASVLGESLTVDGRTWPITDAISPRISGSGRVAYKTHERGEARVLEVDGSNWVASLVTAGHAPVAWDGEDLLIQVDNSGVLRRVRPDNTATLQVISRYAAEGIAKVLADSHVILGNERTMAVLHGRKCWNWDRDAHGNLVCLSDAGHADFGAVALWKADEQRWLMWVPSAHVQEAPTIVNGRVAISGWDTPEPDAVPWVPLTDPQPKPVELPAWPAPMPILIGCLSHTPSPSDPGTIGNVGTSKPVLIEGYRQSDGAPWCPPALRSQQRLIYVDWKESHAKDAMLANAKADQDAYGGTLVFYFDDGVNHSSLAEDLAQLRQAKAEGRAVALGLQCYPAPGKAYEMFVRVSIEIEQYQAEFPSIVLFTAGYKQAWSEVDARKAMRFAADLAHEHPSVVKAIIITKRPPYLPDLLTDHDGLCALSQDANVNELFPLWVKPVVVPPPAVPRPDPTPAPTPSSNKKSNAIVSVIAGIVALFSFWKRKRK